MNAFANYFTLLEAVGEVKEGTIEKNEAAEGEVQPKKKDKKKKKKAAAEEKAEAEGAKESSVPSEAAAVKEPVCSVQIFQDFYIFFLSLLLIHLIFFSVNFIM